MSDKRATVETLHGFLKETAENIENYYSSLDEIDVLVEEAEALLDIRSPEFLRQT